MKQVLQNLRSGQTQVVETPAPSPGPGMVLVRTAASLVSAGTERALVEFAGKSLLGKAASRPDLLRQALDKARRDGLLAAAKAAFNRLDGPMPLGYSSAGTVVEVGAGVSEFQVGDRVACAGGGYALHAEYAVVPVNLVAAIDDQVDFEQAAFSTLGAIALHGFRLADQQVGARIAVIGLGLLGQLAASVAAAAGCRVLGVDLDAERVRLARRRGIEATTNAQAQKKGQAFTEGHGFDAVLVCAATESSEPLALAAELARDRATLVVVGDVGMQISRRQFYAKELNVVVARSYGPGRYDPGYEEAGLDYPIGQVRWTEGRNLAAFAGLLASGAVDVSVLVSHKFPIERAPEAYELLRAGGALGVLLTYPDIKARPTKMLEFAPAKALEADTVGLGVLGAGNFARNTLLPAIKGLKGLELVGIASASGRGAADLGKRFGFRYAGSDASQLLQDNQISAVAVLTRHHLHARQTLDGLAAGKAVYCEKPLALNEKELSSIERALAKKGAPLLTVGYNRRFAPLAVKLQDFLAARGEPLAAHIRVNAGLLPADHWLHDPAQGGGRLLGEGCHFIDFLTFLVGQAPKSAYAQALPDGGVYRQDNVAVTLGFPDGSVGTLHYLANGDRAVTKERVEVFCGGRVAVLDDFRSLVLVDDGRKRKLSGKGDKGHRTAWAVFVQALLHGGPAPIPYDQIFGGTRATFATLQSLKEGRPVQIN